MKKLFVVILFFLQIACTTTPVEVNSKIDVQLITELEYCMLVKKMTNTRSNLFVANLSLSIGRSLVESNDEALRMRGNRYMELAYNMYHIYEDRYSCLLLLSLVPH